MSISSTIGNLANLGYVRTPDEEVDRVAALIRPDGPGPLRVADPCCGEGLALVRLKEILQARYGVPVVTYGTEVDGERARVAETRVDQCLRAPYQEARWGKGTQDVLFLNPPYAGGKLELQFLRDLQETLRIGGLLFYVIRRRYLRGHVATRLAVHFDVLAVYPFLPEHYQAYDQVVVVARRRQKRLDPHTKASLVAIGRGEEPDGLWGYPDAPFPVQAPARKPFYLRRKKVRPGDLVADAERFGVHTTQWWKERIEEVPELRGRSLLPLRDTQIANLLFLGFADNQEFELDGHRYLFHGRAGVEEVDVTTDDDRERNVTRTVENPVLGGVMLSLETGEIRDLDQQGILHLVRAHAEAFARTVTEKVPPLRSHLYLEDWEEQVLSQVYRYKRLPGRADPGLTHVQKVVAAVVAQAIHERVTPAVVLNADAGSGKTGMAFGAALCLRYHYLRRRDYEWFSDPSKRGGHRRRRLRMRGSGGSSRAWMRSYGHPKPFCIAFAAEPHTLQKMAREARDCLPMAHVQVAYDTADVERFVRTTKHLHHSSVAVLIVPKSMGKLGSGWTWAAVRGLAADGTLDGKRPYHCPDCGAVALYEEKDGDGGVVSYPVYEENVEDTLARKPTRCVSCGAPLWQFCRLDFATGRPRFPSRDGFFRTNHHPRRDAKPEKVRYPVAEYVYRRYRDFFDLVVWDEAHDANGENTDVVAAYRYLTSAARLGWIELTASNVNGKASGVFTRAFHASAEVRRRFGYEERAEFVSAYGIHERVTYPTRDDEAGRYTGRVRYRTRVYEAPGIRPHLSLLLLPYTVTLMIQDLGAPLPPRLEVCDEFPTDAANVQSTPFAEVVEAYRQLSEFDASRFRRAAPSKLQACLAYLNAPWDTERITQVRYDEEGRIARDREGNPVVDVLLEVGPTWDLYDPRLLPKEEWLLETLDRALARGHGVSIMIAHVERGIQERLSWLVQRYLGRPARYCDVSARARERWYRRCVRDGVPVIVSHPGKVGTGLDLLEYPWIVFYQPTPILYLTIQAKGRAWRLGQRWPCETHFLYYADTEEHALLQLQADKMIADNLLRGGDLSGGLMDMGHRLATAEMARKALEKSNLRHLGVLLREGATGEWLPPEAIAEIDRRRREERARTLASLASRVEKAVQMALF